MNSDIQFHAEEVEMPIFIVEEKWSNWIQKLVEEKNKTIGFINYIFCTDDYLLDINVQYLDHDYYTDIITFPYKQDDSIEADIYISIDRVKENAEEFNVSFEDEMKRVVSHGILHLIGYSDKDEVASAEMRKAENAAIVRLESLI